MNPEPQTPNLEDSIKEVMQKLPPPIRDYLSSGEYSNVAKRLMTSYALHIDQGGILERETMLLLMGIESPEEFANTLKTEGAIPDDVVQRIMADINQQIFLPLRDKMMKGQAPVAVSPAPSAFPAPRPTIPAGIPQMSSGTVPPPVPPQARAPIAPVPSYAPPKHFHLENKLAPAPLVQPVAPLPPQPMQKPTVPAQSQQAAPPRPTMPVPQPRPVVAPPTTVRTPAPGMTPAPKNPFAPPRPPSTTIAPLPPKMTMPRPLSAPAITMPLRPMLPLGEETPAQPVNRIMPRPTPPPPANLPGAMAPASAFTAPPVEKVAAPVPPRPSIPPPAPRAPGASDPYREPIE